MLRKKWLSFLVAVSMVAAMLPTTAFAEADAVPAGSTPTVVETATGENKPQNTEGDKSEGETSEEEKSNDEKSEGETSEEEKSEGDKSEGEVSEEEKANDDKSEGEVSEDEKSEGETNEDKTPAETPVTPAPDTTETTETPAANGIMLMNENVDEGEGKAGEAAKPQSLSATPETFAEVLASANTGDSINLAEGTYNIGNQQIDKAVSFFGAGMDKTILVGSLTYAYEGGGNVNVKRLTLQAPEDNTSVQQAINLKKADGTVLTVEDCKIVDYLFGIGVNSDAQNCTLKANLTLDNVWCGANLAERNGNQLSSFTVAEGSTVTYQVQLFASEKNQNNYYVVNGGEPTDGNTVTMPQTKDWPVAVVVDGTGYGSFAEAFHQMKDGSTITMYEDVKLNGTLKVTAANTTFDLNGHKIWGVFEGNLVELASVNGVTIKNGTLEGGSKHTLNVWNAKDITLEKLTLDNSNTKGGAPLIVGASEVTLAGGCDEGVAVTTITGENSWYAINVDSRSVNNTNTPAKLTVATRLLFKGTEDDKPGICMENNYGNSPADSAVYFRDGAAFDIEGAVCSSDVAVHPDNKMGVTIDYVPSPVGGAVARIGKVYYNDLAQAVESVPEGGNATIKLLDDAVLTAPINVPAADITIESHGYPTLEDASLYPTIDVSAANKAFTSNKITPEGLLSGTNLTVNGVNFVGMVDKNDDPQGHAAIVGSDGGVTLALNDCTFTNMHDAVYCNAVESKDSESTITISNGMFNNVAHCYGIDNKTEGARVDQHTVSVSFAEGSETPEPESFAAASLNGVAYQSLTDAIAAAKPNEIVQLMDDVQLDSMLTINTQGLQLDLNGHTISASNAFKRNPDKNQNHLVDVTANGVTIANGELKAGSNNNHTLNVWNAQNVTLNGLTLDNTATYDGAPLIVGASDVTLKGSNTFVTGEKSWYGANVDTRKVGNEKTPAKLTLGEGAEAHFTGTSPVGIYVENSANFAKPGKLEVAFEKGSAITTDIDPFTAIVFSEDHNASGNTTVTNPENAGLITDKDGNYVVKPAPAPQPQQPAGGSSHKHNYTWQHSDDEHWQYCADCGQAISNGPHTLQWKDGYQECTVCGYRVGSSTAAAPAAQASAPAAAAPAAPAAPAAVAIPQTGDASNPMLWVVLLAVSGSALGALVYTKKKREE